MFARSIKEENLHAEIEVEAEVQATSKLAEASEVGNVDSERSPALALQDRLKESLEAPADMSSRRVLATFLVVCLSCWVAGIGLYAML